MDRPAGFYQLFSLTGPVNIDTKLYPYALLNAGSDRFMLGLHPFGGLASLIDVAGGYPEDVIYVDGIAFSDPSSLSVFVPAAVHGGTGDVLIANRETQILTILAVEDRVPRIANPLRIGLEVSSAGGSNSGRLLLAADRDLSSILVGKVGSDKLQVFARSRGGLEQLEPIHLKFPIRDITVLHGLRPSDPELFVFLREDGQQIFFAPFRKLRQQKSETYATADQKPEYAPIGPNDIERIQRVLGTLGYQVGAIDGELGPNTRASLRAFQYKNNLPVSGEVDTATLEALHEAISEIQNTGRSSTTGSEAYDAFLTDRVRGFDPSRLLILVDKI
jgi:Putative peptidoglycan binding domain